MQITVREISTTYHLTEDSEFKCSHQNLEIEPPCCSGFDSEGLLSCGCAGQYAVYCPDCRNEDMSQDEADKLLNEEY